MAGAEQLQLDARDTEVVHTRFGFREARFDAARGFLLNGRPLKIKGTANHQGFAGVGVAVPDALQRFRVAKLKAMGSNAWRAAHNPPNEALLDECDAQGMLVWDENHLNEVDGQYEDDLRAMLRRDRNHPSVIIWSLCNEALCQNFDASKAAQLKPIVQQLDPTRPVAAAINFATEPQPFASLLDLMGFNYNIHRYDDWHTQYPTQPMIASESSAAWSDRWVYGAVPGKLASSYPDDASHPTWGNSVEEAWDAVATRDFVAGGFVWSGFGYKGEPDPFDWPSINTHFSILDEAGFAKDAYAYYQAHWRPHEPKAHLLPQHWNWDEANCHGGCNRSAAGMTVDVWAWSNAEAVELRLNGALVGGRTAMPPRGHVSYPAVPYAHGTLRLIGFDERGAVVANDSVATTGAPAGLVLALEQGGGGLLADGDDVALLEVRIVDDEGRLVRTASGISCRFVVDGPGQLIGVGNGDPASHEPDHATERSSFNGLVRAIVQAGTAAGVVTVRVTSDALRAEARVRIPVRWPSAVASHVF